VTKYWVEDAFPFELLPALKELGTGGLGMHGYGCARGSLALVGFAQMEIARIAPSFATFVGVHNGLALGSIYIDGSEIKAISRSSARILRSWSRAAFGSRDSWRGSFGHLFI
jgi:alkylation response protein AidB-like acyl-CoA dehydrogenase